MVVLFLFSYLQADCWIPWASILDCVLKYFETAQPCCVEAYIYKCFCKVHLFQAKPLKVIFPVNDFRPSDALL